MQDEVAESRTPLPATADEFFRDGDFVAFLRAVVLSKQWAPPQDVDDVVQDACVRIVNSWGNLQDVEHARRVAVIAARHAAFDATKARRAETQTRLRLGAFWTPDAFDPADDVVDYMVASDAVRGLPPDQAKALLLFSVLDLTYEEAAEILGTKPNRYKGRLQRARENLRKLLNDLPPAAFVLGLRPRRMAAPTLTAPALVAAAALCLTVARLPALDGLPPSPGRSAAAPIRDGVAAAARSRPSVVTVVRPNATAATKRVGKVPAARTGSHPRPRRLDLPKPSVPASACSGRLCVGEHTQDGDKVCVEGFQDTCAKQDRVAVCEPIHENAFVTCERHGDPAWAVPPPP